MNLHNYIEKSPEWVACSVLKIDVIHFHSLSITTLMMVSTCSYLVYATPFRLTWQMSVICNRGWLAILQAIICSALTRGFRLGY